MHIVCISGTLTTMRDAWRTEGADVAEELLALTDDARPRHALDVARAYANGDATDEDLAEAHTEVLACWTARPDWSGAPALAAMWVTDTEPRWDVETTPWKMVDQAKRKGPPPLRREASSV